MSNKKEVDASALKDLEPKSGFQAFKTKLWTDVQEARANGVTLSAIWDALKAGGLDASFPTFTRWVKKLETEPATSQRQKPPSRIDGATKSSALDHTIQSASNSTDTPGVADPDTDTPGALTQSGLSQAGSALQEARETVGRKDYAKLARQADRKK